MKTLAEDRRKAIIDALPGKTGEIAFATNLPHTTVHRQLIVLCAEKKVQKKSLKNPRGGPDRYVYSLVTNPTEQVKEPGIEPQ